MDTNVVLLLALGIGFVSGLRSMTGLAAVAWAAHFGWRELNGTSLAFLGSWMAVALTSLAAVGEYVADKLPNTPNRTQAGPLFARIVLGGFCGACMCVSARQGLVVATVLGGVGGVIGAFAGYETRKRLVVGLKVKDIFIALPEDAVAIAIAFCIVSRS